MEDEVGARAGAHRLGGALEAADGLREAVAEEDDVDEEAEALDLLHHDRGGEQGGRHCKDIQNDLGVTEPAHFILKGRANPASQLSMDDAGVTRRGTIGQFRF